MDKELRNKSFETAGGGVSSSRVMAWDTWVFLKYYIPLGLLLIAGLAVIDLFTEKSINIGEFISTYLYIMVALFVSAYAPKAWTKAGEVIAKIRGKGEVK